MKRKKNSKARCAVFLACVLAVGCVRTANLEASEIDELKVQIEALKREYQAKIDNLQTQINTISTSKEEKKDDSYLDAEYVGRYEGPFEKGGILLHSGFGDVSVGGYADIEFKDFQNGRSTFDQHRWIINIGAELGERLRFYSEYEIEHGGPDASNSGDGEAKVEQAWIDYLIHDWINVRGGALLVPFGRYNLYHDSDLQDLTDRPIVARDIIPTTWTESGAGFYGEFNPVFGDYEDLMIRYEGYVINGLDAGFSDTSLSGGKGSLKADNNNNKALVGRLAMSPFLGHEIGLSGYTGAYGTAGEDITGGAIDWFSTWGPVEITGEYAHFDVDQVSTGTAKPEFFQGVHVQANIHFWFDFLNDTFLGRDFDNPTFTLIGRYGWARIDDDGDSGTLDNEEERWTIGLNYRPVENWVFKTEYQWNQTESETLEHGNNNGFIASVAMGF